MIATTTRSRFADLELAVEVCSKIAQCCPQSCERESDLSPIVVRKNGEWGQERERDRVQETERLRDGVRVIMRATDSHNR